MNKYLILLLSFLLGISISSCDNKSSKEPSNQNQDTLLNTKPNKEKSYISIFEIPATDISRAIKFY